MGKLEWRTYAELASQEQDPSRLMELAEKLCDALDQDSLNREPMRPFPDQTTPQETR